MAHEDEVDDRSRIKRGGVVEVVRAEEGEDEGKPKRLRVVAATGDPVRVCGADEVLEMTSGAVDMARLRNNAPFLADHRNSIDSILGRVEKPRLENRQLVVDVVLKDSARAREYARDVEDGMAGKVSIGFTVERWKRTRKADEEEGVVAEYTAMQWSPMEISAVAVPADDGAGVRARAIARVGTGEKTMPEDENAKDAGAGAAAPPSPAAVVNNAAQALELGEAYEKRGVPGALDKAHEAIRTGQPIEWLRGEIEALMDANVERLAKEGEQRTKDLRVGLTDKEASGFMLSKLARAMAFPENRGYQHDAGLELEASLEARKRNQVVAGYVPTGDMSLPQEFYDQPIARTRREAAWLAKRLLQTRAVNVGLGGVAASGGGDQLVETILASESFIEYLYNMSVLPSRVMQLPSLSGNVEFPRRKTVVSVSWVEESKDAGYAKSDGDFDKITLSPHKLYVATDLSHTSLIQTDPGIEMLMRSDQAMQKALKLDAGGLLGSGQGDEVQGALNAAGINEITGGDANGVDATYKLLLSLLAEIGADNAIFPDTMFLTDWKMRFHLQGVTKAGDYPVFVWDDRANTVAGFPALASNQLPRENRGNANTGEATSRVAFFSPSNIIMGTWGTDDIQVDPYTKRNQGFVVLSCFSHHDFALRHPETVGIRRYVKNS